MMLAEFSLEPDRRSRGDASRLIHEEQEWRRSDVLTRSGGVRRTVASRWTDTRCERSTVGALTQDGYDIIAITLRPTHVALRTDDRLVHDGPLVAGTVQVVGPAQRTSAAYRAPSDMLHLKMANGAMRECWGEFDDRYAGTEPALAGLGFVKDTVVEQLGRTLLTVDAAGGPFTWISARSAGQASRSGSW